MKISRFVRSAALVSSLSLLVCQNSFATTHKNVAVAQKPLAAKITSTELQAAMNSNNPPVIVDVREPSEFAEGHLHGAIPIPLGQVSTRRSEIPTDKVVVLVCRSGRRSALAQETLIKAGYRNTRNLEGGMLGWKGAVEK